MRNPNLFTRSITILTFTLTLFQFAAPHADAQSSREPASIEWYHVEERFGLLGQPLSEPLQVQILSKEVRTMLGGRVKYPIEGARVRFVLSPDAVRRGASLSETDVVTDAGGIAVTELTLGTEPGIYEIEARLLNERGDVLDSDVLSIVGGVRVTGDHQDAHVGRPLERPVRVHVEKAPGVPLEGAIVSMAVLGDGRGAITPERVRTGHDGLAEFIVSPGISNGVLHTLMRIHRPVDDESVFIGELELTFFGLNLFELFIVVLGGLAIFVFGMQQLSTGLQMIAGERLRQWLNMLTHNRVTGVLAGTFITGLIQSSSTTSVMTIGFVNAGLIQLKQAISLIFGANVGTTVTAQMISFDLDNLALPSIIIGMIMLLVGRREQVRNWAQVLIGFGMLFFGLTIMGEPLKDLKDSQLVQGFFQGLDARPIDGVVPFWPFMRGVMIGAGVTVVIQSSSASIGLLLTLVGSGLLDVWAAFPILLGDNIGTTITAVLASLGANRTARRVACCHVLFNVLGVSVMIALVYIPWSGHPVFMELVNRFTPGDAFAGENIERFLANAHTLFNVTAATIFTPVLGLFERAALFVIPIVPNESDEEKFVYLEPHLVNTPSVAIQQVYRELGYMSRQGQRALRIAAEMVEGGTPEEYERQYERIQRREVRLDRLQEDILKYIQKISLQPLSHYESQYIPRLVQAVNDAERIGDLCVDILKLMRRMHKRNLSFAPESLAALKTFFATLDEMYDRVLQAFDEESPKQFDRVVSLRKSILMMRKNLRQSHIKRLEADPESIRSGVVFIEMITYLEGVADALYQMAKAYQEAFHRVQPHSRATRAGAGEDAEDGSTLNGRDDNDDNGDEGTESEA